MKELPLDERALLDYRIDLDTLLGVNRSKPLIAQARAALSLRDELAECRAKLTSSDELYRAAMDRWNEATAKLAQAVARERELRGALTYISKPKRRQSDIRSVACGALARPTDDSALREWGVECAMEGIKDELTEAEAADVAIMLSRRQQAEVIVSRILGGGK